MESDGEDLDNIFEFNENTDNAERADDTGNVETSETAVKVPVPRRIVRNPRLKFNAERLCGERGIPVLVDHFKNVKFKGPGHEKENLDKLLSKLEHWTHRLFPSMKFEECLQQIEKLGKKKPVQTCLRKIRLDMPILNKDFVDEEEDDDDNVLRNGDPEPLEMNAFDRLLGENQDVFNSDVPTMQNIMDSNSLDSSLIAIPIQNSYGPGQVLGSAPNSGLTDEQKQRIEENKRLAIERRKARLAAAQENSCQSQSLSTEIVSSQSASIQQNRSRNQENTSNATDALNKEFSNNAESLKDNFSHLNNQNTDNLGLDDLIDLVDEEESVSIANNHESESGVELDIGNTKDDVSDLNHQNTENSKSNDLVDLIEEEENISYENCLESESSMEFVIGDNKNTNDAVSDVNCQNTENLGSNDLMEIVYEKEPEVINNVPDKKVKSVHNDTTIVAKSNSKSDYKTSQQNVDASILDINDVEMTAVEETTNCKNTDNLAMESLLDLIDENSMDN